MVELHNEHLSVTINPKGAELYSIYSPEKSLEYLWQGDPTYWGKRSPILFPIVGALLNNQYQFQGKTYNLSRHGFARDRMFSVLNSKPDQATFLLKSDPSSLEVYPFSFELYVHYTLIDQTINIRYEVQNTHSNALYFSIGAHPAFRVPLVAETQFEDYYLTFNKEETSPIYPLTETGALSTTPQPFLEKTRQLDLRFSLFERDALVFKSLQSDTLSIQSKLTTARVSVQFKGFPYMGIWSAPNAPFVCIEPWCGIADSEHASGQLEEKEGIIKLDAAARWEQEWSISCF
jgi:galactose mutarotase-like enzyme